MSNKPNEEEVKLADDLDIVIKSLENYFYFVYAPDFITLNEKRDVMGLLVLQPIPLGDNKALDTKLYIMDEEAPFFINAMKLKPKVDTNGDDIEIENLEPIPDGVANDGTPLRLSLFNLILHIYEACDLTDAQKEIIETKFIIHFQEDIHEVEKRQEKAIKEVGFKIPQTTLKMNAKTARAIFWDQFRKPLDGQETMIPQGNNLGFSIVALKYMGDDVTIKRALISDDERVYNAIINLYVWAGQEVVKITLEDIWAAMNGITGGRVKLTNKRRETIVKSIDKLRNTDAWINVKHEFNLVFPENSSFNNQEYKGNLLYCDGIAYTENGVLKATYRVFRQPILYEYCKMKKQIITINTELLNVRDECNYTDKVMTFRDLLISEITYMRHDPKTDRKRLLSTLYEKCTLEEPETRKGKHDDIEVLRKILTSWKKRNKDLKFIDDFYFTTPGMTRKDGKEIPKKAKNGDTIDGIYIILHEEMEAIEEK